MILNKIICGEFPYEVPDESVHLILTSPNYDNIRDYDNNQGIDLMALGKECYRALVDGGIMVMVIQDQTKDFAKSLTSFRTTVKYVDDIHFRLFECVIYQRDGKPGAWWSKRFRVDHEYMMIFLKGRRPRFFDKSQILIPAKHAGEVWAGTQRLTSGELIPIKKTKQNPFKCPGTVWKFSTSNTERDKRKMKHPATFPDKLAERVILAFSKEGDTVLDPMVGSGTTAIQAKKLGRNYIGYDISRAYCDLAEEGLALVHG